MSTVQQPHAHVAMSDSSDDEDEAAGSLSSMMAVAPSAA
eukprot:COSAG01_NODE_28330_length_663_cov_2.466312_1_plen_38_part_10